MLKTKIILKKIVINFIIINSTYFIGGYYHTILLEDLTIKFNIL